MSYNEKRKFSETGSSTSGSTQEIGSPLGTALDWWCRNINLLPFRPLRTTQSPPWVLRKNHNAQSKLKSASHSSSRAKTPPR